MTLKRTLLIHYQRVRKDVTVEQPAGRHGQAGHAGKAPGSSTCSAAPPSQPPGAPRPEAPLPVLVLGAGLEVQHDDYLLLPMKAFLEP